MNCVRIGIGCDNLMHSSRLKLPNNTERLLTKNDCAK